MEQQYRQREDGLGHGITVCMAAGFIVIILLGFIPDSFMKIAEVDAGERPPFPVILHVHAVLMGAFLLLLLAQATLAATGRFADHRRLGMVGAMLAVAIVAAGIKLVPTMYHEIWTAAQNAAPETRAKLQQIVLIRDNIMLLQLRMGILFPLFMIMALRARKTDTGLHKRMMILAVANILPPAIDRITWLPSTFPASPIGTDLYTVIVILPMLGWDILSNRSIHKAYKIWLAVNLPFAVAVHALWSSPWWISVAPHMMME